MHSKPLNIIINTADVGQRLDKFITNKYPDLTRSFIQNLIRNGYIKINNKTAKAGVRIKQSDNISIVFPQPEPSHLLPENISLDVIFEDDDLIVINKPAGMVVHPGAGNRTGTLVNALLYHCQNLSGINGVLRPGIVHRLDKNTSGLLVAAKNDRCHLELSKQFETREISRIYQAIIWGVPNIPVGEIITYIGRSRRDRKKMAVVNRGGKDARTQYTVLKNFNYLSHLSLSLSTGRTHQIRVHLNHIQHPVFGDPDYNGRKSQIARLPGQLRKKGEELLRLISRQALHAKTLKFIHPLSKEKMIFDSPLPEDIRRILQKLDEMFAQTSLK